MIGISHSDTLGGIDRHTARRRCQPPLNHSACFNTLSLLEKEGRAFVVATSPSPTHVAEFFSHANFYDTIISKNAASGASRTDAVQTLFCLPLGRGLVQPQSLPQRLVGTAGRWGKSASRGWGGGAGGVGLGAEQVKAQNSGVHSAFEQDAADYGLSGKGQKGGGIHLARAV